MAEQMTDKEMKKRHNRCLELLKNYDDGNSDLIGCTTRALAYINGRPIQDKRVRELEAKLTTIHESKCVMCSNRQDEGAFAICAPCFKKNTLYDVIPKLQKRVEQLEAALEKQNKEMGDYATLANANARIEELEAALKEIAAVSPYPTDVFPSVSKAELRTIATYCRQRMGFPIDRLAAHIGRLILENPREIAQAALKSICPGTSSPDAPHPRTKKEE